jgi:hypothetical protein
MESMATATTADSVAEAERKPAHMLRQMNGWAEVQRQGSTFDAEASCLDYQARESIDSECEHVTMLVRLCNSVEICRPRSLLHAVVNIPPAPQQRAGSKHIIVFDSASVLNSHSTDTHRFQK